MIDEITEYNPDGRNIPDELKSEKFTLPEWVEAKNDVYDLQSVFDEQISPLMVQVENLCLEHGIPYTARFITAQTETGNSAIHVCNMGGVNRATPELMLIAKLEQMSMDFLKEGVGLLAASLRKYSPKK